MRPGTYNIESRYDQMDKFHMKIQRRDITSKIFEFKPSELESMQKAFRESGLESVEINMFNEYAHNAIEMREASKFVLPKY